MTIDARAFAVIADADEIVARPALLAAFAAEFGPDDDVTLVLATDEVDLLPEAFAAAAASVALDDDAMPDVLALPVGSLEDALWSLAPEVHAVLSDESPPAAWERLPWCSGVDASRLRRLCEMRAECADVRGRLPERFALPPGYVARDVPVYFDDTHRAEAEVIHQPDVYEAAAALARRTGATHIIDIGCGAAGKLLALAPEFELIGVDFGDNLEHCRRTHPQHTWLRWDIELEAPPELSPELLGRAVIVCADVIEHLVDPTGLLVGLRRLGEHAQMTIISTPDRERVRGLDDPGPPQNAAHVREWSLRELVELLTAGGLPPAFAGHTINNDRDRLKRTCMAIFDPRRTGPVAAAAADFDVLAVIPAYNEADVIEHTVTRLVEQGVRVRVVDNWSTDDTVARVEALGLGERVRVERFPAEGPSATYDWQALLRNTERIAAESGADWVIHHDADEVRESPWPGVGLRDALHHVQRCGFNAIDHTVIDFVPVDDGFAGGDVEGHMRHFRFGTRPGHFVQVKAWRADRGAVDLAGSGGHDAQFSGRDVFPYKFLLKHYPLRSQEQGRRKVFVDRRGRGNPQERAMGWHTQYDAIQPEQTLIVPADELLGHDAAFATEYLVERLTGAGLRR